MNETYRKIQIKAKTHELKTWPVFFQSIIDGIKTFEVRDNDRKFQVGDILNLREYDPDAEDYTGRYCSKKVVYILSDNPFFQLNNMVIMGIAPIQPIPNNIDLVIGKYKELVEWLEVECQSPETADLSHSFAESLMIKLAEISYLKVNTLQSGEGEEQKEQPCEHCDEPIPCNMECEQQPKPVSAEEWFDKNEMNYKGIKSKYWAIQMLNDFASLQSGKEPKESGKSELGEELIKRKNDVIFGYNLLCNKTLAQVDIVSYNFDTIVDEYLSNH
jgi:hypothetical protein